jgi:hypothetical protein
MPIIAQPGGARLIAAWLLITACFAGCGSKPLTPDGAAAGATGSLAGSTGTAGTGSEAGTGLAGTTGTAGIDSDAGTGAEIPLEHRATATCPHQRGPGPANQPYPPDRASPLAPDAGGCTSDSRCKNGMNGRCFPFEGLVGEGGCSYDECLTDANCGSKTPCLCRSSSTDNSANVCVPGGNCAVDSDCGSGGYCSPSWAGCQERHYFCHTTRDTCINDTDCPVDAGEFSCSTLPSCAYDTQAQRWACRQQPIQCCPP